MTAIVCLDCLTVQMNCCLVYRTVRLAKSPVFPPGEKIKRKTTKYWKLKLSSIFEKAFKANYHFTTFAIWSTSFGRCLIIGYLHWLIWFGCVRGGVVGFGRRFCTLSLIVGNILCAILKKVRIAFSKMMFFWRSEFKDEIWVKLLFSLQENRKIKKYLEFLLFRWWLGLLLLWWCVY